MAVGQSGAVDIRVSEAASVARVSCKEDNGVLDEDLFDLALVVVVTAAAAAMAGQVH